MNSKKPDRGTAIADLRHAFRGFAAERDWNQFHSPKNLAMALAVEAAELLEHFQWLTQEESKSLDDETLERIREEIGDIQIFLTGLADKLGIDSLEAAFEKLEKNAEKYPIHKAKGSAKKYTDL